MNRIKKFIHQKGLLPAKPSQNDLLNDARSAFLKRQKTKKDQEQIELFMLSLSFVQKLKTQYGPLIVADLCRNISYLRIPAGTQIQQFKSIKKTEPFMQSYQVKQVQAFMFKKAKSEIH